RDRPLRQPSCGGQRCLWAVSRDGLTVDPAPWNPGLKYGARRRKFYEGQGARNSILAGARPRDRIRWRRPVRSLAKAACGRGGPYVSKKRAWAHKGAGGAVVCRGKHVTRGAAMSGSLFKSSGTAHSTSSSFQASSLISKLL